MAATAPEARGFPGLATTGASADSSYGPPTTLRAHRATARWIGGLGAMCDTGGCLIALDPVTTECGHPLRPTGSRTIISKQSRAGVFLGRDLLVTPLA